MRRAAALVAIAAGVVLIALPLAYSMFGRTADAESILDRFTFLTLDDNPDRYLAEAEVTRDGSSELTEEALPALAAEAGMSEAELSREYPALADAQETVPEAFDFSVRYSEQLEAVEDKFQSVYDIPVTWLPLTAVPWQFLLAGLACLVAGVATLRSEGRGPVVATLALGLALMLGPVAFGAFGKSADGEDVKDFAEKGLTQTAADAAQDASASLDALVIETEQKTLPDIAQASGASEEQLEEDLAARYPDSAEFLAEWEVIGPRLSQLADAVSASVDEFDDAKQLPIAFPVWVLLGAGLVMALAAGLALRSPRREPARGENA